jgi:DNA-binding transcriptional LysR family regulator
MPRPTAQGARRREFGVLIQQLRYLDALAQEEHFARAAERCGVSQPTLSAALKQLEDELGVALVERGNRFRGFTAEGKIVLHWARRMLDDERSMRQETSAQRGALRGTLRLGVIPSANALVPPLTTPFVIAHPDVEIDETETTSNDIRRRLAAFELDAGITYIDNDPLEHVRTLPIAKERYVIAMPADSPLAELATVTWKQAAALPLCLLEPGMQNRRIVDGAFASVGVTPQVRFEAGSMMAKLSYLASGTVSSIMPSSLEPWLRRIEGVRVAPLVEPEISHTIGLVIEDRQPVPTLIEAFWSHVAASTHQPP